MDQLPVARRRWLRFSLRTLLVAITLLCVWLAITADAARRQHEAVTAISKSGGELTFDYQWVPDSTGQSTNRVWDPNAEPSAPSWLRSLAGEDAFRTVTQVDVFDCTANESDFAQIGKLTSVQKIVLDKTKICGSDSRVHPLCDSDLAVLGEVTQLRTLLLRDIGVEGAGLSSLVHLPQLRTLWLDSQSVTDAAMEPIGKMTALENLLLRRARVTDAGLIHLRGLTSLDQLYLDDTQITGVGLQYLNSKRLGLLDLSRTAVDDDALRHIGKQTSLISLVLNGTLVTDAGLEHLQNLSNLDGLWLCDTKVSDYGLRYLKGLKSLTSLWLDGTAVTPEGVRDLQKSRPNCAISGP